MTPTDLALQGVGKAGKGAVEASTARFNQQISAFQTVRHWHFDLSVAAATLATWHANLKHGRSKSENQLGGAR